MDTSARARELALLGIEVRATQSQNTGNTGGGTLHEPKGSPKGGQFTASPSGGGGGYKSILPPDSGYKSGGSGKKKATAAVPQGVPQPPAEPRTMKSGDSGEDVRYAQYAMNLLGFKVAQDGNYGPETEAAVKQIQARLGVKKPNGHLSAAQLHKLQDAVRLSPCIGGGQRDLEAEAQWEARFAEPDDEPDIDEDGLAEAVTDALDEFVARSFWGDWEERAHDVSGELRIPGGVGGGRWTKSPVTAAILKALKEAKGPDSFTLDGKPIEREPLRKAAVARGITLKRGASRDDIVKALLDDVGGKPEGKSDAPSAPSPRADAKASGINGSTIITDADLTPSGGGNTLSQAEQKALHDRNAKDISARWDASQADKDALMKASNSQWFAETAQGMSPAERNEAFVRGQLERSESGVGPVTIAGATAVADRLGYRYDLGDSTIGGQVAHIRANPELDRATSSLGEATYANGQAWLNERGIKSVDLYRQRGFYDDKAAITSWSASEGGTFNAPQHEAGRELRHEAIPSDRIFSFTAAGHGSLEEKEFLVFSPSAKNARGDAKARYAKVAQSRPYASAAAAIAELTGKKQSNAVIAEHVRAIAHPDSPDMADAGGTAAHDLEQVAAAFEAGNPALGKRRMTAALKKQGITQGPGGTVPFDPAAHEHLGAASAEAVREVVVENKIRAAFRGTGAPDATFVDLAKVRENVGPDFSAAEVDNALRRMERDKTAHLAPQDYANTLTPKQKAAAVKIGGRDNHLIRIDDTKARPLPDVPAAGTPVAVVRPGMSLHRGEGDHVQLSKAVVMSAPGKAAPSGKALTGPPAAEVKAALDAIPVDEQNAIHAVDRGREYLASLNLSNTQLKQLAADLDVPLAHTTRVGMIDDILKVRLQGRVLQAVVNRYPDSPGKAPAKAAKAAPKKAAPAAPAGLTQTEDTYLSTLHGADTGFVPAARFPNKATLTGLESKGYVRRVPDGPDEGSYEMTPAGRKAFLANDAEYPPAPNPAEILSSLPADLTPAQKRARLRSRGVSKAEIDALVPLAPRKTAAAPRTPLGPGGADDLAEEFYRHPRYTEQQIHDRLAGLNLAELKKVATATNVGLPRDLIKTEAGPVFQPLKKISADDLRKWIAAKIAGDRKLLANEDKAIRASAPDVEDLIRSEDEPDEEDDEDYDDEPSPLELQAMAGGSTARARELALLGVTRAAGHDVTPGHDELHHYWTVGEGRQKWVHSPKPWTTLVALLTRHVGPEKAKIYASRWFIEVKGYAAGSDLNRVAHGQPPRGHRVGPG